MSKYIKLHTVEDIFAAADDALAQTDSKYMVDVTFCKDCIHFGSSLSANDYQKAIEDSNSDLVCDYHNSDGFGPYDFCSKANRRK